MINKERILEKVELALEKGEITSLHINVRPNDGRDCRLFSEKEVEKFKEEISHNFKHENEILGHYELTLEKDNVYLSFAYKKTIDHEIDELEKKLAELKSKKESNEMEEVC